jgi:hypothetical protein
VRPEVDATRRPGASTLRICSCADLQEGPRRMRSRDSLSNAMFLNRLIELEVVPFFAASSSKLDTRAARQARCCLQGAIFSLFPFPEGPRARQGSLASGNPSSRARWRDSPNGFRDVGRADERQVGVSGDLSTGRCRENVLLEKSCRAFCPAG